MNSAPSGDEEPHVGPPAQPPPAFSTSALTFVGSVLLVAIAFSLGLSYLLWKHWSRRPPTTSAAAAGGFLQPSMFHVTAISPGASRMATVNGQPVGEGGSVTVSAPSGPVQVRVTRIEDGLVRFVYGDEQIDVSPDAGAASPGSP
jgi:hypothetical protein